MIMRQRISEWAYINKWLALEMSGATLMTTIVIMLLSVRFGSGWVIVGAALSAAIHLFTKELYRGLKTKSKATRTTIPSGVGA